MVTDRPDQTDTPFLIPKGALQIETGFTFERDQVNGISTSLIAFNSTMIKYGVSDKLEFRFVSEYLGEFIDDTETISERNGFSPITIGAKLKLANQNGFWPQAGLISQVKLRTGSKEFSPTYTTTSVRVIFSNTLSKKISLDYNFGLEWNGETPEAIFLGTASLSYSVNEKLTTFFEGFTFFQEYGKADNRIDAGITYLVAPLIQIDVMGGVGLFGNSPSCFLGSGVAFRFLK